MMAPSARLAPGTPAEVRDEYAAVATRPLAHERAKWGSGAGMRARFRLALESVALDEVRRWLDVGCGEAGLFALAEAEGARFDALVGVDLVESMLARARERGLASPARFACADLVDAPSFGSFDLVTLIGVLQRCGHAPQELLAAAVANLAPSGQLFLTSKNAGWSRFERDLEPEPGHSWFDPDEIAALAGGLGVAVEALGGFEPRSGERLACRDAHTFYLYGRRA